MQHGDVRILEAQDLRGPQKPCLLCWKPPRAPWLQWCFLAVGSAASPVCSVQPALLAPPPTARVAKKTPKPPDGSGESALCDVTLPISLPGEGPRPQPGVGPAPFETLFILCPQRFFGAGGGRLFYCLQVNLHLHLLFFNVIIFLCRLVFRCTIQRFLNFCTIQLLIFCDFFF